MSKITESARGQLCQIRMSFICNHDKATTVWAHANGSAAGKGIGMKAHDLLGSYACSDCHSVYDRSVPIPKDLDMLRADVELAFWEGHARSLVILIERRLIVVQRGVVVMQ